MIFRSSASAKFWELLDDLPLEVQERAARRYHLFAENPFHPSLHFKQVGEFCSVRVTGNYPALTFPEGNDFLWIWIGPQDEVRDDDQGEMMIRD